MLDADTYGITFLHHKTDTTSFYTASINVLDADAYGITFLHHKTDTTSFYTASINVLDADAYGITFLHHKTDTAVSYNIDVLQRLCTGYSSVYGIIFHTGQTQQPSHAVCKLYWIAACISYPYSPQDRRRKLV